MARPNHHIRQPALHQNYIANNTRNVSQGLFHPRGPRHTQPRNAGNRNNHQGNIPPNIIGMSNDPGNAGQSSAIFPPQHVNVNNRLRPPMFITGQVTSNIHPSHNNNLQQAPMYSVNNQMPQIPFSPQPGAPPQSQQYFSAYPTPIILPHNIISFQGPHHPQMTPYCLTASSQSQFSNNTQINVNHMPNTSSHQAANGGNDVPPQVTRTKHNVSPPIMPVQNNNNVNNRSKRLKMRPNALMNIIDPATGRNIAEDIYRSAATSPVKNEKPCIVRITHPNPTQNYKPPRIFPKLSITVSPSSTLSSTMTSIYSKSPSPIPVSTSSRSNSPNKSSTGINNPANQEVLLHNEDNNEKTVEKSNCVESSATNSNSQCNNHLLTSVPEEHYTQSQADGHSNEKSCQHKNESNKTSEELTKTAEKSLEEKKPEVSVSPKTAGLSKNHNGKSQKKKNKRKSKNRDLNRNQVQNLSTSSEETHSNTLESSKQNVKETKPTLITEIKEEGEEEPIVENVEAIVCDSNNVKDELIPEENHKESTLEVKIEQPINDQQQDTNQLELSKEKNSTLNEVKPEKSDINIEAPSLENSVKSENESVKIEFSSQEINLVDINNGLIEIPGDTFPFRKNNSFMIYKDSENCYIRGLNGINFFFKDMSNDTAESNQNQPKEEHINGDLQDLPQRNNEKEAEPQENTEAQPEQKKNSEMKVEPQENTEVQPEQKKDSEMKAEPQENTEVQPEQKKDSEMEAEQQEIIEVQSEQKKDSEMEAEQQEITEVQPDQKKNSEMKAEPQENTEVKPEQKKDSEMKAEPQENTEVQLEQKKDSEIVQEQLNCSELGQMPPTIHRIEEIPETNNDTHEEQQSNTEIKNDEKQNDDKHSEKIEIEEKRRFIKPPAYENCRTNLDNIPERKVYSRQFLIDMKDNEECWIRPNLPDVDIVKHNVKRPSQKSSLVIPSSREKGHELLFPSFSRSSFSTKPAPTNRRSFQGKSKLHKPAIIHVSLSLNEDIKLRQTENAWKPTLLQKGKLNEEKDENTLLFKKVRSILNKLTPEKFDSLVKQVKQLDIDSLDKLEGVIDILFQKAIDEPLYATYYALMCKELADKSVSKVNEKTTEITFKRLILERCQNEFEKNSTTEDENNQKAQNIQNCKDDNNKKIESELELEEEKCKSKRRYLGNIKFVGELYKQRMIFCNVIKSCIKQLLNNSDEESLETLCKLLATIGKLYEEKEEEPFSCFDSLEKLIHKNKKKKLSSRIRFMIQDIIELRKNKWVPRRKENNPQTISQIQEEVETERIIDNTYLNVPSQSYSSHKEFTTPQRDEQDSNNDRRRSRLGSNSNIDENGWSSVRNNRNRQSASLSIKTSKLNVKPPAAENTTFGNRSSYIFDRTVQNKSIIVAPNKYASLDNIMKNGRSIASSDTPEEFRPEFKSFWTDGYGSRNRNQRMSLGSMPTRDNLSMPPPPLSISRTPTPSTISPTSLPMSRTPTPPTISPSLLPISKTLSPTFLPISRTPTPPPTPSPSTLADNKSINLPIDENKLRNLVKSLLDESSSPDVDLFIKNVQETIEDKFNQQSYPLFIEEALNSVLERNQLERQRFSVLLAQLIKDKIIPLSVFQAEFEKILEFADDLVIDIPQCWKYFAEILLEMVAINAHPFIELTRTLAILKSTGKCGKLLGELLSLLAKEKTPKWVIDNWNQSGLEWIDLINSGYEKVDDILEKYNLEFLVETISNNSENLSENSMTLEQISEYLLKSLEENNFDSITSWISLNIHEQSKQPKFVRCLVTNILKTSIEAIGQSSRLKQETFCQLLPLITRYVDAKRELELQCLYAIQSYNCELFYPQGVLSKIIDILCEQCILSDEAFIEWGKTENPNERDGHAIAMKTLTSFFTKLREAERDDSSE